MEISLTVKNIVLVGAFQPSKFDKYYFLKYNIFDENEISEESIFTTDFTLVVARGYNLSIATNQIVLTETELRNDETMVSLMDKIVSTSNFTASGFGFNLHWFLFSGEKTSEIARKHFYNEKSEINNFFKGDDISYGAYLSKNFGNSRLKLDIKPSTVIKINSDIEQRIISFAFNFHTDLKGENFKVEIKKSLSEVGEYINETRKIISIYE